MNTEAISVSPGAYPGAKTCPACGIHGELVNVDGDSVYAGEVEGATRIAEGLAVSKGGYCFHTLYHLWVCQACKRECYTVELDIIARETVSHDWAYKYIWQNIQIDEPEIPFTVTVRKRVRRLPKRWLLLRIETAEGLLERHWFGPFLSGNAGSTAAVLAGRVWPILTGLPARAAKPEPMRRRSRN
jgi:hypothetical protein